jgi:hypothetical protein
VRDLPPEELAIKRLQMFLNGPYGTEAERKGAETALAELRSSLPQVPAGFKGIPEHGNLTLPTGKPAELLRQAEDKGASLFDRFPLALAAGREFGKTGDKAGALAAYRTAYELIRARFPAYSGVTFGLEMSHPRSLRLEPMECSALRHAAYEIRRLDPEVKTPIRGGLRFRIVGLDLPPDLAVVLTVTLWDPKAENPGRGAQQANGATIPAPLGGVPVQLDQTAWIGVADGHYRLSVYCANKGGRSSDSYGARANMLFKNLELDFSELEKEVVVEGKTVELRPIRARLRD